MKNRPAAQIAAKMNQPMLEPISMPRVQIVITVSSKALITQLKKNSLIPNLIGIQQQQLMAFSAPSSSPVRDSDMPIGTNL